MLDNIVMEILFFAVFRQIIHIFFVENSTALVCQFFCILPIGRNILLVKNIALCIVGIGQSAIHFDLTVAPIVRCRILAAGSIESLRIGVDVVDKIKVPVLFIAGEKDPTVHPWHTKELYDKAKCEKKYKEYKNGYHAEDLFLHFEKDFSKLCLDWLRDEK